MEPTRDPYAALRNRDFLRILLSYAMTTVAREGQIVVVGWQVFERTKDPLSLGMIGLAEALPFIAVALYAGHISDRMSRRTVALAGTFGLTLSGVALFLFTLSPHVLEAGRVWPIYLVVFVSGIARSFTRPSLTALSAEVIPRELYPSAIAWRTSSWQFAAVLGPALGGLLYGFYGPAVAYATVTVLMGLGAVSLFWISHRAAPENNEPGMPIGESLRIGIRFVMKEQVILAAMSLDLFSVLFGGAVALLPIFAKLLEVGPQGLGALRSAPALGSVLMGIYLAHRRPMQHAGRSMFIAVAVFGCSAIAFALSRNFWLSLALLTISGMADNISVVIRSTLIQTLTPDHLLGRVSAVNMIFIGSSNEIGDFESGVAARLIGAVPAVVFGGIMTLLVVAITAWRAPVLRKMQTLTPPASGDESESAA